MRRYNIAEQAGEGTEKAPAVSVISGDFSRPGVPPGRQAAWALGAAGAEATTEAEQAAEPTTIAKLRHNRAKRS
jgi:hypothetical protein